jgi:mannosyl-oligosaccharide alpha-1,2-mannosidase
MKHPEEGDAHKEAQEQPQKPALFDWATVAKKYPVKTMVALPTGAPIKLPRIQHDFSKADEDATAKNIRETRQAEVKKQFLKCWKSYRGKAWMHDELRPISGGSKDGFGGWAATLIDTMDTLWIMGLKEEFHSAIADIEKIDFGNTTLEEVNLFETNIRHLGGLLVAYELSGEKRLLAKAKEVGEMLYHAFDTPNHMPVVSRILTEYDVIKLSLLYQRSVGTCAKLLPDHPRWPRMACFWLSLDHFPWSSLVCPKLPAIQNGTMPLPASPAS